MRKKVRVLGLNAFNYPNYLIILITEGCHSILHVDEHVDLLLSPQEIVLIPKFTD